MRLRPARPDDLPAILRLIGEARRAQASAGFTQWPAGYPAETDIKADIKAGGALLLAEGTAAAGYACLAAADAEYDRLAGVWQAPDPAFALHRVALADAFRGRGLGIRLLALAEAEALRHGGRAVRVDTAADNRPMRRLLERAGYACRGPHLLAWGPRLVYEKALAAAPPQAPRHENPGEPEPRLEDNC